MSTVTIGAERAWFTSDPHFWHKKAAEMRGYKDVDTMNEAMVAEWNSRVRPHETVFILGDLSFAGSARTIEILEVLKGKLVLVRGNHDKGLNNKVLSYFESVHSLLTVKVQLGEDQIQRIVCCHFPMLSWDMQHHGAWHLHGHSHGSCRYPEPKPRILDVGVDPMPHFPMHFSEIEGLLGPRPIVSTDYHNSKTDSPI